MTRNYTIIEMNIFLQTCIMAMLKTDQLLIIFHIYAYTRVYVCAHIHIHKIILHTTLYILHVCITAICVQLCTI
jgi:hypothetical protein